MYNLFLDDLRDVTQYYPGVPFITARTYAEAVTYVEDKGLPKFVSFDHDLGDVDSTEEMTGYSFAKYLVEYMMKNNISTAFEYKIHSANPIGADNIRFYLENAFAFMENNNV